MRINIGIRKKPKTKNAYFVVFKRVLILLLVLFVGIFLYFEHQIKPMVEDFTEIKAQSLATKAVNVAVENLTESTTHNYFDLADVQYAENGEIKGITTKTYNINKLKSTYSIEAQKQIDLMKNEMVGVNMGELIGFNLLKGLGPEIPIYLSFLSSVETEVKSSFVSAGYNQTQHIIELIITAEIYLTSDEYIPNAIVTTNVPIAQTVIVGETPTFYTGRLTP